MPNDSLTVQAFASRYGLPSSTVYNGIYRGRIPARQENGRWLLPDIPPPTPHSIRPDRAVSALSDYDLTLLWLNGCISGDAVMVRSLAEFIPRRLARVLDAQFWQRSNGQYVCKIRSVTLLRQLQDMGFTGRQDSSFPPPPVEDAALAAAFVESRTSFLWQLRYHRRHPRDKSHAYYVPKLQFCASYPILLAVTTALQVLGIIPPRRLSPGANGTSAVLALTSAIQLEALHTRLSPVGHNAAFWASLDAHIHQQPIPWAIYQQIEVAP